MLILGPGREGEDLERRPVEAHSHVVHGCPSTLQDHVADLMLSVGQGVGSGRLDVG